MGLTVRSKTIIFILLLFLVLSLTFSASAISLTNDKIILILGHLNPITHPSHDMCLKFASLVEERTNGKLVIEVYPAAQLGSNVELFSGVKAGLVDIGVEPMSPLVDYNPLFAFTQAMYMFRDVSHMQSVFASEMFNQLKEELIQQANLRILAVYYFGTRHLTCNKPIYEPKDMEGLRFRSQPSPIDQAVITAFGATPSPMSWTEVIPALKFGTIIGQENPIPFIYSSKTYEVQKYIILTGHQMQANPFLMNEDSFQKLPDEFKAILINSAEEAVSYGTELTIAQEETLLAALEKEGMKVIGPKEGLKLEEFRIKGREFILKNFGATLGYDIYEKIDAIK